MSVEHLWKAFFVIVSAVLGFLGSLTAAGIMAIGGTLIIMYADVNAIGQDTTETKAAVHQLDGKVDGLDKRLTALEEKDAASDDRIEAFWEREWPPVKKAIEDNRDAIEDLRDELRERK